MEQRELPKGSRNGDYNKAYLRNRFWRQTPKDKKVLLMKETVAVNCSNKGNKHVQMS